MMRDLRGRCRSGDLSIVYAAARGALVVSLMLLVRPPMGRAFDFIQFSVKPDLPVTVGGDAGPKALTLADVNGDTNVDIIAIDKDNDALWVLYGHGDGTFDVPNNPIDLSVTPNAIAVADVSSRGHRAPTEFPDMSSRATGDVGEILLATGKRTFNSEMRRI